MVTGCRSKRSELPFSAAYNLFFEFLPFKWIGRSLWMAAVAYGPRKRCAVTDEASKQTFPVNSHK